MGTGVWNKKQNKNSKWNGDNIPKGCKNSEGGVNGNENGGGNGGENGGGNGGENGNNGGKEKDKCDFVVSDVNNEVAERCGDGAYCHKGRYCSEWGYCGTGDWNKKPNKNSKWNGDNIPKGCKNSEGGVNGNENGSENGGE